jgi:hypothetical protein
MLMREKRKQPERERESFVDEKSDIDCTEIEHGPLQ